MNFIQNLPMVLPEDMATAIRVVERSETWVSICRTRQFLEDQHKLHALLHERRSSLEQEDFLRHFAVILAFSTFLENCALLKALAVCHEDYLDALLATVKDKSGNAPNPQSCWGALRWRLKYAIPLNILFRVFSEERLQLIKTALKEDE